jgi:hypothetical protein
MLGNMKCSTNSAITREKIRKYTNRLRGVNAKTFNPKRTNPTANRSQRLFEVRLNFFGGRGINHIMTQITKKTSRFKLFSFKRISRSAYLRITGKTQALPSEQCLIILFRERHDGFVKYFWS